LIQAEQYLVTINAPPGLEESLVDCLLTFEFEDGFSSFPVSAHDHRNAGLSLVEQVSGRQRKIRFQIYIPQAELQVLLNRLCSEFSGADIQYWVLPVIEQGKL